MIEIHHIEKPDDCRYVRGALAQAARDQMAQTYRAERAKNPAAARQLWRLVSGVEKRMVDTLLRGEP